MTRSSHTIGFEMPAPGSGVFQATPDVGDQWSGDAVVGRHAVALRSAPARPVLGARRAALAISDQHTAEQMTTGEARADAH